MGNILTMGIDIGTTGIRAALFDESGVQKKIAYREYPMICSEKNQAEIDPDTVFGSLIEVVRECTDWAKENRNAVSAAGISTQMHSCMAVDGRGGHLTNLFTWADSQSIREAEFIGRNFDCRRLYRKTGCRVQHPMYPLSKILWMKNARGEIYKKADRFITIKEYILYRLYHEFLIDITDASAMGCFNITDFVWDDEILTDVLQTPREKFGQPVDCTYVLRGMDAKYASRMGIDPALPVAIGSGDGIMANLGCGVMDDTKITSTIGTSGALRTTTRAPLLDEKGRTWCYCFTRDRWVAGGAINDGGLVLKWLKNMYPEQFDHDREEAGAGSVYQLFDKYASEISPGSDGLLFLPYLTGQRSPDWNANARGTMHGLQLLHGRRHAVRAVMEGVIFSLFSVYEGLVQMDGNITQIVANGGYTNSDVWLQIQADVFDKEIAVANITEAAAYGAALIGMAGAGILAAPLENLPRLNPSKVIGPQEENVAIYQERYREYQKIYRSLYS